MKMEEIKKITEELTLALIENMEASQAEQDAKIRRMKAHYRLSKVEEEVRNLKYEIVTKQ